MSKLDTSQQKYALDRIEGIKRTALEKLNPPQKHNDQYRKEKQELVKALTDKGFVVDVEGYLEGVSLPTSNRVEAQRQDRERKSAEIRTAALEAKDQIMLGDSVEVTTILANLAKALGV